MSQPPVSPPWAAPPPDEQRQPLYGGPPTPAPGWYPAPAGPPAPQIALVPRHGHGTGKTLLLVLVGVLVLLGAAGGGTAYYYLRDDDERSAEVAEIRVVAPERLLNRPRITEPQLQMVIDGAVAQFEDAPNGVTSKVGAAYGDLDKRDVVLVIAAATVTENPGALLDSFVKGISTSLKGVTMSRAEPGPLGGVAKCGDASDASGRIRMGVCAWADQGSFGMISLYFKTGQQLRRDFGRIRAEVEQKPS